MYTKYTFEQNVYVMGEHLCRMLAKNHKTSQVISSTANYDYWLSLPISVWIPVHRIIISAVK